MHRFQAAERAIATEQLDEARADAQFCLRLWPRSAVTNLLAARIERLAGNLDRAEEYIQVCRRLQGGTTEESQLATLLVRVCAGDLRDIETGLWQCVAENHPKSEEILEALALAYTQKVRYLSALRALSLWIERAPGTPRAWHWRGNIHRDVGKLAEAAEDYEHALEGMPWRWDIRLELAGVQLGRLRPDLAWPPLEALLQSNGDSPKVLCEVTRYYLLKGDARQARTFVQQATERRPDDPAVLLLRGKVECENGNLSEGERWLRKALALQPRDLDTLWELYRCLTRQPGRGKEAEKILAEHHALEAGQRKLQALVKSAEEETSDPVTTAYEIGVLSLRLGAKKQGLQALLMAVKANPQHRPTLEALIQYYEQNGEAEQADHYRQLLKRASADAAPGLRGP